MTAPAKLAYIPDIVEEHYDELQFLWTQRRRALRAPGYTQHNLAALEERIEAHLEGMLVIGERLVGLVESALSEDGEMPAFAAALALLRLGTPEATQRVADAFVAATGERLSGLCAAVAHAPAIPAALDLPSLFGSGPPHLAAAAGEILAFRGATFGAQQLHRLVCAQEPAVRAAAWRIAAYCVASIPSEWYERGLGDDDATAKREAVTAAAWNAYPGFPAYCRTLAVAPTPESTGPLVLLASISPPEEYLTISAAAAVPEAGPGRYGIVGAFGHPHYVDWLIAEMSNADPASAVAAGVAFTKMTGRDVESDMRAKVSADGKPPADAFEAEFQDEVFLPDPALARKHWQELASTLAHSPRICRGMDVSRPLAREQVAALDRESLWEYCLRSRLYGGWQGTPLVLERYPQRF